MQFPLNKKSQYISKYKIKRAEKINKNHGTFNFFTLKINSNYSSFYDLIRKLVAMCILLLHSKKQYLKS